MRPPSVHPGSKDRETCRPMAETGSPRPAFPCAARFPPCETMGRIHSGTPSPAFVPSIRRSKCNRERFPEASPTFTQPVPFCRIGRSADGERRTIIPDCAPRKLYSQPAESVASLLPSTYPLNSHSRRIQPAPVHPRVRYSDEEA